jgi:caffeoyl-CoA O-methyltransferase
MEHPGGQISPTQGKLFQVLALTCRARKILEIGAYAGYSGVWLGRALPPEGKLISLEIDPRYAEIARATFAAAGLSERAEVRVGAALDLLPELVSEAPFDMIFLDADKINNTRYLEWALTLSRPGALIIADNLVRHGRTYQNPPPDASSAGAAEYTRIILEHPRLVSAALLNDDVYNGIDGFSISVVK